MSQEQYIKILKIELQKINEEIDRKIVLGEQYKNEAKKHRVLLERIRKHASQSFLGKIFNEVTRVFTHA